MGAGRIDSEKQAEIIVGKTKLEVSYTIVETNKRCFFSKIHHRLLFSSQSFPQNVRAIREQVIITSKKESISTKCFHFAKNKKTD